MSELKDLNHTRAERLAEIFINLHRLSMPALMEKLDEAGLNFPQYFILTFLYNNKEGLLLGEISQLLAHSTPATTHLMDELERLEYAERCFSKSDRRKITARISPLGAAILQQIDRSNINLIENCMSLLTAEEIHEWISISQKINGETAQTPSDQLILTSGLTTNLPRPKHHRI